MEQEHTRNIRITRDKSIDILKCLAALIITWSHFEKPLGEYSMLATGGSFGDVLFFFCSGYTLFLGRKQGFFNYYKRRIQRIYPTIFSWALISCLCFGANSNICEILINGGGWFVSCIMIYYVLIWFIREYALNHVLSLIGCVFLLTILVYFIFGTGNANGSMYYSSYFKWIPYFMYMLLGAFYGVKHVERPNVVYKRPFLYFLLLCICVFLYYAFFSFYTEDGFLNAIQLLTLFPLFGFCVISYRLCNSSLVSKLFSNKTGNFIIRLIGGLCLEIYLVQFALITDSYNSFFPFNIILIFFEIIIFAYLLRCISRLWSQTFKDGDYDWLSIISWK